MKYRILCDKEEDFLKDGLLLEDVYGELPYKNLSLEEAKNIAAQLNEFSIDDEKYEVIQYASYK